MWLAVVGAWLGIVGWLYVPRHHWLYWLFQGEMQTLRDEKRNKGYEQGDGRCRRL